MKKIIIVSLLIFASIVIPKTSKNKSSIQTWPEVCEEQRERDQIMLQIAVIKERFTATGAALSSPALKCAIQQLLQQIGTPLSYKIYQEMVASGELR